MKKVYLDMGMMFKRERNIERKKLIYTNHRLNKKKRKNKQIKKLFITNHLLFLIYMFIRSLITLKKTNQFIVNQWILEFTNKIKQILITMTAKMMRRIFNKMKKRNNNNIISKEKIYKPQLDGEELVYKLGVVYRLKIYLTIKTHNKNKITQIF